jgi:hypothetical protein
MLSNYPMLVFNSNIAFGGSGDQKLIALAPGVSWRIRVTPYILVWSMGQQPCK